MKKINFTNDINKLTQNFTGRQWVFDDIDRWLRKSDERFFILTGEPGVGKSAIAARLTQIRKDIAAYHFCRAGDVETVRPGRILRSLAAQLTEHLPDYGQALANTIKPIYLRVEVNINIDSMTGSEVTGVYIENLKESDPENELDILIRAPLEELQKMYTERRQPQPDLVIILIDSLDEAVTTTGTNFVKLLTQLSKSTSLPPWIRFIMTSRPERRVLRGFEPLQPYHLEETSNQSLSDISEYVNYRVAQPALNERLEVNQVQPQALICEITNLSSGNFLYTTLLLNDLEAGRQALDNITALPKSIDDIYHGFLSRFSEEDWKRYKPIFGVLTVAQEPISEKQISNFTRVDPEDVRDSIRIVRQFFNIELDGQNIELDGQNEETYSIFHQSLRDYLLDKGRNPDFWCNKKKQHERIVESYRSGNSLWSKVNFEQIDRYGLRYLAEHLQEAQQIESLFDLARNAEYAATQQQEFPEEPELPLKVVKLALQEKAQAGQAEGMAEFLLLHAQRLIQTTQESPLNALQAGNLKRAWRLAAQSSRENRILWQLLLAWALVSGDKKDNPDLERLQPMKLFQVSGWKANYAAYLLEQILPVLQDFPLVERVLNSKKLKELYEK